MTAYEESVTIVVAGVEGVEEVEVLWKALHQHHEEVAPHFGITLELDESWKRRKANYQKWLREAGTRLFIAKDNGKSVGYVLVRIIGGSETWKSGDRIAELETFSILPGYRRSGVGTRLMDEIYTYLRKEGIREIGVNVVDTNVEALKFYKKAGFDNRYVYLWGDVPEGD
jgi:ribosomal protein S18 acetylase RimI-like enzyme